MAQKFLTEITLQALNNATTDTDQFLVSDSGTIKFRTGSQMLSDIVGYTPANDANVVHKTGNESIAGIKTFTQGNTTFSNATGSTLAFTTGATTTAEIIINTTFTQFTTFGSFGYLFNGYSGGGISNLLTLDQSGNGIFSANVRATSFTDKDNTAYYLNPAAFSNLYDITANTFVKSGGTSAQYLMADGSVSTGPSLAGYVPTSRTLTINGVTYDLSADRSWTVSVTETDTLATVVDRGNTTNGGRPISMDTSGGGISIKGSGGGWATGYYFTGTAGTYRGGFGALGGNDTLSYYWIGPAYNAYYAYVDVDQLYHTSSVRAPIFYDSNNTAYYLDIATQSEINKVYYNSNMVSRNFGIGQVGVYSASRYQAVFSMGEAYVLPADGTSPSNLYGMAWSHPNAGGVASNLNTHGLLVMENGTFLAAVSGSIRSRDDMRAPIFYDSNNTGYYVDPSATSSLVGLTVANTISGNISGGASYAANLSGAINASTSGISSMKYNDTRYWVTDPNAPGNYFQAITLGNGTDFTQIGVNSSNSMYFRFNGTGSTWYNVLSSNNYSSYAVPLTRTITINGSTQSLSSDVNFTVSASSIPWTSVTGKPSNIFYYQGFTLDANTMDSNASGFTYANNAPFNGPVARFSAASGYDLWLNAPYGGGNGLAFRTKNGDINTINPWKYPAIYGVNVNGGGDLYASIYYDQNDTTYYLDPNNTTKSLNVAGKLTVNVGSSSGTPVFEATGTYGTMSINTYYGVLHTSGDFYIGNPASTGNNLSGNYAYFSIFYDRNNSAYYIDPASGSNLNTGNLAGRWKYSDYLVSNNSGGLMGDYNISGTAAKCIWTIGESWPLGNMYGLAYEYDGTYAHSLSLKANGTTYARLAFGSEGAYFTGGVTSGTAMSSPVYYDSANSAYYFDGSDTGDSIRVAGDIVAYYSDERLKDRKGNIENALEKVLSLNGFYYEPNETAQALGYKKKLEVGVSAQEVQAILPEIIKDAPIGGDYKTLDYGRLTPLLIEAIKEQQTQIDELKELVNKLINK